MIKKNHKENHTWPMPSASLEGREFHKLQGTFQWRYKFQIPTELMLDYPPGPKLVCMESGKRDLRKSKNQIRAEWRP